MNCNRFLKRKRIVWIYRPEAQSMIDTATTKEIGVKMLCIEIGYAASLNFDRVRTM